ncbi:unnamed protein product [Adineta steineri]|uniref:Uncharacterized protein n=1 Tax=Adineta steineri TaxID=433720 RepID=A0A814PFQ8_9BILA|nr:unnamed protein product [Adineta steineri]CAF1100884.1 unnamed protein product [Adineta steineri]CAF1104801.1 unnamed protein product [Adineta steineri]
MGRKTGNEYSFARLDFSNDLSTSNLLSNHDSHSSNPMMVPDELTNVEAVTLNVYIKFNYPELSAFVKELEETNDLMQVNERAVSALHLCVFRSAMEPIDMSNQTGRTIYRPNLFTQENISTIEHLRLAAANESTREKLIAVKYLVKQMIQDYAQLNIAARTFNQVADPYEDSKATLLDDIHRVRRYFYYITSHLQYLAYLDRRVIKLATKEIRLTYDDDGNVLRNIENYLRTFCLQKTTISEAQRLK